MGQEQVSMEGGFLLFKRPPQPAPMEVSLLSKHVAMGV